MKTKAFKNQSNGSKSVEEKRLSRNKNGGRPHTPSLLILKLKTKCHF